MRVACLTVGLLAGFSHEPATQAPTSKFGTCAWWQDTHRSQANQATRDFNQAYRIGVTHGFALGMLARIPAEPYPDPGWARLNDMYLNGYVEVFQRPAILIDAFDAKCGDYKNRGVGLADVGLLIALEIGGASATGIDKALEVFRGGGDPTRALNALIAAK
jgi:hypothetical protein